MEKNNFPPRFTSQALPLSKTLLSKKKTAKKILKTTMKKIKSLKEISPRHFVAPLSAT